MTRMVSLVPVDLCAADHLSDEDAVGEAVDEDEDEDDDDAMEIESEDGD